MASVHYLTEDEWIAAVVESADHWMPWSLKEVNGLSNDDRGAVVRGTVIPFLERLVGPMDPTWGHHGTRRVKRMISAAERIARKRPSPDAALSAAVLLLNAEAGRSTERRRIVVGKMLERGDDANMKLRYWLEAEDVQPAGDKKQLKHAHAVLACNATAVARPAIAKKMADEKQEFRTAVDDEDEGGGTEAARSEESSRGPRAMLATTKETSKTRGQLRRREESEDVAAASVHAALASPHTSSPLKQKKTR
eukprot:m51a1_g14312 hypothetical protein (251) ;mRNA; r:493959-494835